MYYYKYTHDIRSLKDQHNTDLFSIIVCLTCWKFKLYKTKKSTFFFLEKSNKFRSKDSVVLGDFKKYKNELYN